MSITESMAASDKSLWSSTTRSFRISGIVTSVRLENVFWQTLEEMANGYQIPVSQMVSQLHQQAVGTDFNLPNFTSYLRVCCCVNLQKAAKKAQSHLQPNN